MNPAGPAVALELEAVEAGYGGHSVLRGVTLALPAGGIYGLLGPNGAGKTTLLRAVTGLLAPARGVVRLFGRDVRALRAAERARLVGVVPQDVETPMPYTVEEIVRMGRTAALGRWRPPCADDLRAAERAMAYTDVIDLRHRPFPELSGGEKQRAVIAMVLAQRPRMILMDEPTSHLDMNHRLEVMQIVERLHREEGATVLIVSHDLNLAAEFCSRLVLLDHGRVAADGAPREALTEEVLREAYHCDVRVTDNPANGSVLVMPAPRPPAERPGRGLRVHVVGGGGCGEELIRRLCLLDYTLSCGVLNEGDSDAEAARALGVATVLEAPFSPVGPAALARARELAAAADALIVSAVPFGTGNAANLELGFAALQAGRPVFLIGDVAARDFTPDRRAADAARRLADAGARVCRGIPELLPLLPVSRL